MIWNKKQEILDYFADLVNQIDLQTEKALKSIKQSQADERNHINVLRDTFIKKVKEIEEHNLTKEEHKFCFFIPNKAMKIREKDQVVVAHSRCYSFFFLNKIGYLFILRLFLNKKIIDELV